MPSYVVIHKVRTVANLHKNLSIEGFRLQNFAEQPTEEAWAVSEEVVADDFLKALNHSRERLLPIIDALAFVTQCSFSLAGMSFMVYRLDDNPQCVVYFRHLRSRPTVGMPFWQQEQAEDVSRLLQIENAAALRYFRHAVNASTSSACLALLATTAEALAGQGTVTGNCQKCGYEYLYGATDRTKLEAVLGTDAYNQLYKKKNGAIRNRLMHGHPINEDDAAALCDTIYKQILRYLKDTLELKTIEEIVGAPRRFDSLQWFGAFLRLKERIPPSLHELEQNWQQLGDWVDQPPAY